MNNVDSAGWGRGENKAKWVSYNERVSSKLIATDCEAPEAETKDMCKTCDGRENGTGILQSTSLALISCGPAGKGGLRGLLSPDAVLTLFISPDDRGGRFKSLALPALM